MIKFMMVFSVFEIMFEIFFFCNSRLISENKLISIVGVFSIL